MLTLDLPGHGGSAATSHTPPDWAKDIVPWLDSQGLDEVLTVGHSAGGWTALELAKLGRTKRVLALMPAGLWRKNSPRMTDLALSANWRLGRLAGERILGAILGWKPTRAASLRSISAKPGLVPAETAISNARAAIATESFPRHFAETRQLRFKDGQGIAVPVKVVWGEQDRIALPDKSRNLDQLPAETAVETWRNCGHMPMWDAPDRLLQTIREFSKAEPQSGL